MTLTFICLFLALPILGISGQDRKIILPELTGPHTIGLTHLELIDASRSDPFSPKAGSPRDLMLTIFYPTAPSSSSSPLAPQFGPATASHIDAALSLRPGTAALLTTRAHLDAPPLASPSPPPAVLLFSHGFGFVRGLYSALLSELASYGWVAVAVDHPYDAGVVEYPDGRTAEARDWSWPLSPAAREEALGARVRDLLFVREWLSGAEAGAGEGARGGRRFGVDAGWDVVDGVRGELKLQCQGQSQESGTLNVSRVAVLGHSFGGAAAVQALMNSSAAVAAADLDGYLYGPVVRSGTEKPVLVLGFPEHFATDDPDAAPGWPGLKGWKRDFTIAGTVHESYSDYSVFADLLGDQGPDAGTIRGRRMVEIIRTYIDAFFRKFVLGTDDEGLLDGNSSIFAGVSLRRR
ncbi:hypothetical protein F5X99DRAFT_391465 [Biscogniauxia marginata]|nr:hypothetical protein F5X99DRAFT_391465 [Biscogniauxia marginata]